jgi:hypothetical protein
VLAALDKDSGLAQSNDGVDPHSTARGDIARRKRHNDEDASEADKGERIAVLLLDPQQTITTLVGTQ